MQCYAPITIRNDQMATNRPYDRMRVVRCGSCEACLKTNINGWSFRLLQEAKRSFNAHFITLTYNPRYVPVTDGLPTLKKKDLQLFFKRLRKKLPSSIKIKYFAVGEYGSKSYRPHYHAIVFNVPHSDYYADAWRLNDDEIGNVHVGTDVINGAIPYTLKYMYKKGLVPAFEGDSRLPEFRIMSKKLGDNWLTPQMIKWFAQNPKDRQYVIHPSGNKMAMPRFYREKLIEILKLDRTKLVDENEPYGVSLKKGDKRSLKQKVKRVQYLQNRFETNKNQNERSKI
jgi:hypothetical protein